MSFWNEVKEVVSDVAHGIGDVATDVWHGVEEGAEFIGDVMVETLPLAAGIVGTIAGGPVGGFIGGTGADYLQSMLDRKHSKDQLEFEMAFNAEQAALNRQFQVDMWNANNQYNSPQSQLQRLMYAGVNPNMMFGNGYNAVGASAPGGSQASSPGSIANGLLLHRSQIANLMAQVRKTNSETSLNEQSYGWNQMTEKQRYDALVNSNEESRKRIDKLISDKDIQEKAFAWAVKLNEEDLKIKFEQANVLRTQWMSNLKSIEKTDQEIIESQARVDLIGKQAEGQDIQNKIATIEKEFATTMGLPLNTPLEQVLFGLWKKGNLDDFYTYIVTSHSNGDYIETRSQMELRNVMNKYNELYAQKNAPSYAKHNLSGQSVYYPAGVDVLPSGKTKREYQFEFFNKYRDAKTKSQKSSIRKRFNQIFGPEDWPESLK